METLIGGLAVLLLMASVIDYLLTDSAIAHLRESSRLAERKLIALNSRELAIAANKLFLNVFDAIYGPGFLSWRRFWRSCFLSVMFVVFSTFVIGIENTLIGQFNFQYAYAPVFVAVTTTMLLSVNLLADFISLQETRLVMGRAQSDRLSLIAAWVLVDLIVTTLIYVGVAQILLRLWILLLAGESVGPEYDWFFTAEGGLPFFVSTFGTSILWFVFVLFVVVITTLKQSSKVLALVFSRIGDSAAPARAVAGIITIPTIFIFGLVQAIRHWLF